MKKLLLAACIVASVALPARLFAQTAVNQDFCKDDLRPAVRAYCKNLAELQAAVNLGTATVESSSNVLNKLDLTNVNATVKFITATADRVAVESVITKAQASNALRDAGQGRLDRQMSANSNASGTSSLVSKAGSPELLSLALDTGVLTQSVNGTTVTLTTNADQVFRLVTGNDPDCTVTCTSSGWLESRILVPANVAVTVNLAQQSSTTTATSGQASGTTPTPVSTVAIPTGAGKVSGVTARYQLLNKFDPRQKAFQEKWKKTIKATMKSVVQTVGDTTDVVKDIVLKTATPLDREKILEAAKSDRSGKKLADFFATYFEDASAKPLQDPEIANAIGQVMRARAAYRNAWFDALAQTAGTLLTFEYNYAHAVNQPYTNDFKLIYANSFETAGMLTFNGSVSLYGTIPAGAKYGHIHYGQVSAQYDRTMSGKNDPLQTQLSVAGYWQYQPEPSVLNIPAGTVAPGTNIPIPNGTQEFVGTAGSLWVTQAKLTIKGAGGINVPLGVSWSNKTNLLQGSKVGAQIGVIYNFTSLAGLFSGGN